MLSTSLYRRLVIIWSLLLLLLLTSCVTGQDIRQRSLNKLADYAAAYYRFSRLSAHTTKVFKLPSFVSGLDSNEVYSVREILNNVDRIASGKQDSVLNFVKESLKNTVAEIKVEIANPLSVDYFGGRGLAEFNLLNAMAQIYLNTVDSVLDVNFNWQHTDKGWMAIERDSYALKNHAVELETGSWNGENGSVRLKKKYAENSPLVNVMFSTSCVFDIPDLSCYAHSFVAHATRAESLRKRGDDRVFKFDYTIDGLIKSPFYKTIKIDQSIQQLLDVAASESKNILEPDKQRRVATTAINISPLSEDSAILWFRNVKNVIYISPYFIRAVFINVISRPGFSYILKRYDPVKKTFKDNRAWTQADINSNLAFFENTFIMNFVFIIGHELAHTYLGSEVTGDPSTDEFACDCFSFHAAQKIAERRSFRREDGLFGSFTSILKRCYESDFSEYWGLHQKNSPELKGRFEKLIVLTDSTICAN